jgi:AraC-like DNA-binding protein
MCRPGTLLLIDSGESHDMEYPPGTNALHIWLAFIQNRILGKILSITNGRISAICPPVLIHNPALFNLLNQGWSNSKSSPLNESLRRERLIAVFSLIFIELLETAQTETTLSTNDLSRAAGRHRNIIHLIEEHIRTTSGSGLSIDRLAKIAGYSKFHFLRLFKSVTGNTVHDYINMARLNKIHEMEAHGAQQKEIAAALGFSCPSAFSHWRKSQTCRQGDAPHGPSQALHRK